ncbi:MAG: hypothetical protein PWP31_519 [Clostridia bacterium]|nr:hypothetical protein [Clostridia bacterium]
MDKLEHIFELQERFDTDLAKRRNLKNYDYHVWIQKEVLAIISELGELLEEVNFKWWKNPHPLNHEAIKGELVDILHFLISMCVKSGIDAEELYKAYINKNKENFLRQQGLTGKKEYKSSYTDE